MLRIRDADAIGEAGVFQQEQANALDAAFSKLIKDVNSLQEVYTGAGATANINAFMRGIANYENVIKKIRDYGLYQQGVYTHDSENISKTSTHVSGLLSEPLVRSQIDTAILDNNKGIDFLEETNTNGGVYNA